MKNYFLIGIAATAMLVSCSNDETMETAQPTTKAIGFDGFVNKSTRGLSDDITNANFSEFQVWGWMAKGTQTATPFGGTKVTKDGTTWGYENIQYWEPGYNYWFTAIAPVNASNVNVIFTAPDPITSSSYGSIAFNNGEGTTDLIWDIDNEWATQTVSTDQCPGPINFTFKHLLSRVKFQFESEYLDGSTMKVTDVKITNANMKATATLNSNETATWSIDEDNKEAELSFGDVLYPDNATTFTAGTTVWTDHKYMIPKLGENQVYTVSFTLTRIFNDITETYEHIVKLPVPTDGWQQGHSYLFVAKFKPNCPIKFTATVEDWKNWEPQETGTTE